MIIVLMDTGMTTQQKCVNNVILDALFVQTLLAIVQFVPIIIF
jgi:hypothetical protein